MAEQLTFDTIVDLAYKKLQDQKFDDFIIHLDYQSKSQLRFAKSKFTVAKNWDTVSIMLFGAKNKSIVTADIHDFSPDIVNDVLNSLALQAQSTPKKEDYMGISQGPFSYPIIDRVYDDTIDDFTDIAVDKVQSAINKAEEVGAKNSAGVLYWNKSNLRLLNSNGANASFASTSYEFTIRSFVDPTSSGQGVQVGRILDSIDFEAAGRQAGEFARLSVGGKAGKPGRYNVVLTPTVAADIIAATPAAANPFYIDSGFSWLKDKIGEQIGPEFITVYDDAIIPNGLNSKPFDDEGHPTGRSVLIENGILKGLIHNTSTAKKAGTVTTGNAGLIQPENTNIYFEKGDYSFEELLEESRSKPTLYITSNWYTRYTSYVEGIFSTIPRDGMFLIEDGTISKPVRELRISDTMPNIFANIKAIGNDLKQIKWWEVYTPTFIPSVLIEDVKITAASS